MSLFKCKMCGGDLEIAEGITIAECEYCGTKQTVPKAIDENLQNLFNRANTLRIKSEFDKAEKIYEKIIQADSTQSEAYWGLILCKYGIEYVDDPATFKKIPTCHRASYDSIIADDDYKSALENADMSQRAIYEEQAREIDRIQKEILALAQKEETYDVFICYKETDADGRRTQDSVIANDIYYQLKQEGFKVFYAAITLEGKLGSAYEPIIFAALNSAKVMLSIGTKPEYFNAVWVKNEWSRFLKIIKKDRSKLLIPCYRDMDAYELPEEFAHLQAQDMAKIGFINDLVRGIKKVVKKDDPKLATVVKETVVHNESANVNIAPLLERAFMFLEDRDWESANEYCEKVLDQDPKNAQAYLGKLMAELHVRTQEDLQNCTRPFNNSNNYQKAIRFGDATLKNMLTETINHINARIENARLEEIYKQAHRSMEKDSVESLLQASKTFASIKDFKDSANLSDECLNRIYEPAVQTMQIATSREDYLRAINRLEHIKDYKDAKELIAHCNEAIKEFFYDKALNLMKGAKNVYDFSLVITTFKEIPNYAHYRDVSSMIETCQNEIEKLKIEAKKEETYNKALNLHNISDKRSQEEAIKLLKTLDGWRDSDQKIDACYAKIDAINERIKQHAIEKERKKKKAIITTIIVAIIIAIIIAAILVVTKVVIPNNNYNNAIDLMESGKYSEAISALEMLDGYKDSADKIIECHYLSALELMDAEKYTEAISAFTSLDGYKDSKDMILLCKYNMALALMDMEDYSNAILAFTQLKGYKDCDAKITECNIAILDIKYDNAVALMNERKYEEAISAFQDLDGYKNSNDKINDCNKAIYDNAIALIDSEQYEQAIDLLEVISEYRDSKTLIYQCQTTLLDNLYQSAIDLMDNQQYTEAYNAFEDTQFMASEYEINDYRSNEIQTQKDAIEEHYITQAEEYANKGNYIQAKSILYQTGIYSTQINNRIKAYQHVSESNYSSAVALGLTSITVPHGISEITSYDFKGCKQLKSIIIPIDVTKIGTGAFQDCTNLESITIPFVGRWKDWDSVGSIRRFGDIFSSKNSVPSSIKHVVITDGNIYLDTIKIIPEYAFSKCTNIETITITGDVQRIDEYAFSNCTSLETILLPSSLESIYNNAFFNCTNLTSIYYAGTTAQWNEMFKGYDWDENTGIYTIYCSDGEIIKQ